jgi:predicted ATPase
VLSVTTAAESPTVALARREMMSWGMLQLEPSALREPDSFGSPRQMEPSGRHLPATLARLVEGDANGVVLPSLVNRLMELIDDVGDVILDRDEKRELIGLIVKDRSGTRHAARSLSDGTLRFLALATLAEDPTVTGLICLEEPENGIHPSRLPGMLRLLRDHLAMSVDEPVGEGNPLRQVIINTHSPGVIAELPIDDLLAASTGRVRFANGTAPALVVSPLAETWRAKASDEGGRSPQPCSYARLLKMLGLESRDSYERLAPGVGERLVRVRDLEAVREASSARAREPLQPDLFDSVAEDPGA